MSFIKNQKYSNHTDYELVMAYKASFDLEVLSALYLRYTDLVYGVCLKYLEDSDLAKDAVMNIYEELVSKLQKYEVSYFKSWLYQLAKNHCLMQIRRDKKFRKADVDISIVQNEEIVHLNGSFTNEDTFKHMQFCLDNLGMEQKRTVELFYLKNKCYNEIVEITGIEWKKVRSLIQNGRRNLKICMDKQMQLS